MSFALENGLGSALGELESRQRDGRLPPAQVVQSALRDETFARRVSSLFQRDNPLL
jgi:hypothetical protein